MMDELNELEPSWTAQLDVVGMQPHAREYVEYCMNNARSHRKFQMLGDSVIDHTPGIQFSGTP